MSENGDYAEIRAAVRKLCERFPGEYWRKLDRERTGTQGYTLAKGVPIDKEPEPSVGERPRPPGGRARGSRGS